MADGSAAGVDVELSARLAEQLSSLAGGLAHDQDGVGDGLQSLVRTLSDAVSGYAALRLTVVHTGHPVHLTALQTSDPARSVVSSLRLPLPLLSPAVEEGSRLVLWSTVPGSFVDLAADLDYVLRGRADNVARTDGPSGTDGVDGAASPAVGLDLDLPPPPLASGIEGLEELATINRAAGILIAEGHEPGTVHEVLRSRALGSGLSTHAWADRLLRPR